MREVPRTGAGLSGLSEGPAASLSWAQGNGLGPQRINIMSKGSGLFIWYLKRPNFYDF